MTLALQSWAVNVTRLFKVSERAVKLGIHQCCWCRLLILEIDMIKKIPEQSKKHDPNSAALNNGSNRRRLIKAAATVAPVILTLRSGATQAVVSACTADPKRFAQTGGTTYCSALDDQGSCVNTALPGEIINPNSSELCSSTSTVTDYSNNSVTQITYCPTNTAIYSANAVASFRCYDQPWNPN